MEVEYQLSSVSVMAYTDVIAARIAHALNTSCDGFAERRLKPFQKYNILKYVQVNDLKLTAKTKGERNQRTITDRDCTGRPYKCSSVFMRLSKLQFCLTNRHININIKINALLLLWLFSSALTKQEIGIHKRITSQIDHNYGKMNRTDRPHMYVCFPFPIAALRFVAHELQLVRLELRRRPGNSDVTKALLLGDIHTDPKQRPFYRPTSYQSALVPARQVKSRMHVRVLIRAHTHARARITYTHAYTHARVHAHTTHAYI